MNQEFFQFRIDGKVALVTGGTKGIGLATAKGLASAGANVVVASRNQKDCDRVADELKTMSVNAMGVAADITDIQQVEELVDAVWKAFGKVDVLVNNAGAALTKPAEEITEQEYDHLIAVDQKSVFLVSQAVGRKMIQQQSGTIINMASMLGLVAEKQVLPYCVAKGGVIQMTKALALEWARHGINVNAICPGYIITPMNEKDMENETIRNHILKNIPMRRFGQTEEIAAAAVYLASPAARYMTGQCMVIDGGWTAK